VCAQIERNNKAIETQRGRVRACSHLNCEMRPRTAEFAGDISTPARSRGSRRKGPREISDPVRITRPVTLRRSSFGSIRQYPIADVLFNRWLINGLGAGVCAFAKASQAYDQARLSAADGASRRRE